MSERRLKQNKKTNHIPPKWDGKAAERIVGIIGGWSQLPPLEGGLKFDPERVLILFTTRSFHSLETHRGMQRKKANSSHS